MIKQNFYIDQTLEHTHLNKLQTDIETIIEENISFIVKDGIVSKDIQLVDKKLKISNFLGYKNGKKLSITSDEIDISPFTSTETKVLSIFVLPKEIYSTPIVDGKNQTILYNKEDSYQFNIFFETTPHGLIDIGTLLCDLYITESNIDKIDLSRVRKIQSFDNFFVGSKIPETKSLDEITRAGTYFGWYDSIESKPTLNYMTQKAPVAWQFRLSVFLIESRLYQLFYSFAGEIFYRYTDSNNFFLNWIDYSPKNMLNKNNNLSDLYNISIARNNISVYSRVETDNKDLTTLNSAKLYADKGIFLTGNDDLNTIKTPGNYRGYSNNTTTNHSPALYNFYLTVYYNDKRDGGDFFTQEIIFNNGNKYTRSSDNLGNFSTDSTINFGWLRTANINDVTTAVTTSNNYTDLQINSHDSKHFGAFYQKSETYNRTDIDNKDLSTLNSAKLYADKGIFLTGNDDLNTIKTPGNYRGYSNNTTTNHSPALYNYYLTVYYNDKRDGGDYITQEITFDNGSKHTRVSNNLGVFSTDSASNFGWEKVAKETFVDAKINDNILVGEIKILAGIPSNISNKYLLCDGSAVKRTDYPDLFSVISITWGAGDSITTFNLPDLRGMFLRGSGSQTIFSKVYNGGNIGDPSKDFASVEKDGDNDFQDYSTGDRIYAITSLKQGGGETKPVSKTVAYYIKAKK